MAMTATTPSPCISPSAKRSDGPAPKSLSLNPLRWSNAAKAGVASAIVLASGVAIGVGPAAAWLVDTFADGISVWRLGKLKIEGVTGPNLGALRAETLTLEDENGVWAEARNIELNWRPSALFVSRVEIATGAIGDLHVLRQPVLGEATKTQGRQIDARIGQLNLQRIALDEAVYGAAAEMRGDVSLTWRAQTLDRFVLHLARQDSDADQANIELQQGVPFTVNAHVRSEPGGIIARAFGVGEHGLKIDAEGEAESTARRSELVRRDWRRKTGGGPALLERLALGIARANLS